MYSPVKEKKIQRIVRTPKKIVIFGKRKINSNKKVYIKKNLKRI